MRVYKEERGVNTVIVEIKRERDVTLDENFGVSIMNVKELKVELKERGLPISGRNTELAARVLLRLQTSLDQDAEVEDFFVGIGTEVSLKGLSAYCIIFKQLSIILVKSIQYFGGDQRRRRLGDMLYLYRTYTV